MLGSCGSSFDRRAFSVTESFSSNPSAITMGSSCGGCMAIGYTVCDILCNTRVTIRVFRGYTSSHWRSNNFSASVNPFVTFQLTQIRRMFNSEGIFGFMFLFHL